MTMEQVTAAITDLARSIANIYSRLSDMAAQQQWPMPLSLLYGMPGYGMKLLPFQDVQPMVLPFQDVHPMAPLFQGVQITAPVPIHHLRMLLTPSYVMASTTGSVFTMASAQPSMATTTIALAPTTGAVVLHVGQASSTHSPRGSSIRAPASRKSKTRARSCSRSSICRTLRRSQPGRCLPTRCCSSHITPLDMIIEARTNFGGLILERSSLLYVGSFVL
jgi:hypothetical protein